MSKVKFLKKAEKDFRKISKADIARIFGKIENDLYDNPGKHKEFKNNSGIFSYRIGMYRVIYTIEEGVIVVAKIGHRKDVYVW